MSKKVRVCKYWTTYNDW